MKQVSLELNLSTKKTRKREFLEQMNKVVPWEVLVGVVEPHWPKSKTGRPPFAIETMLRIHYLQQWFGLSDPAMEEALHDVPLYREFIKLDGATARLPDETTILRFRHLLERHDLAVDMLRVVNDLLQAKGLMMRTGTAVDATLDDVFHLDNGVKIRNGDGALLVGGEAFAWRPWLKRPSGSKAEMINKKGQFELDEEVWGLLGLVWPRPGELFISPPGLGDWVSLS